MIPPLPHVFSCPVLLGKGRFGSVYRAFHPHLDRPVVIKILNRRTRKERESFLREAVIMGRMHISCIPQIYDAIVKGGRVYFIMQWVEGIDLQSFLKTDPPILQRRRIADALLRALAQLHSKGFAHRDLKPANVLLSPDHGIILIDFGMTRHASELSTAVNAYPAGTPAYLAPELLRKDGPPPDLIRADVYALGMIMKDLLGADIASKYLESCADPDPLKRPSDASDVLKLWDEKKYGCIATEKWEEICGAVVRVTFREKILDAARRLAEMGKLEDAYRLGLECLRKNPDHPDTLKFMNDFEKYSSKKRRRTKLAKTTAALMIVILVSVILNFKMRENRNTVETLRTTFAATTSNSMVLPGKENATACGINEFRIIRLPQKSIYGTMKIKCRSISDTLFIDGMRISRKSCKRNMYT